MKKLLVCLLIAIPIAIIFIVNFTTRVTYDYLDISVDGVELNTENVGSISIDQEFSLTASVYPQNASNKKVLWSSSNEKVAVVDSSGRVDFVGCGEVYITATTADGGKSKSCFLYVTDTKVHSIDIVCEKDTLTVGEGISCSAIVYPAEALNKDVVYTSYDESVVTISPNGYVTAVGVGYATVCATSVDGGFCKYQSFRVVTELEDIEIETENMTVSQPQHQLQFKKVPEFGDVLTVEYHSSNQEIATVSSSGLINFHKPGNVSVLIVVNKTIQKKVSFVYTAGLATDLEILSEPHQIRYLNDGPLLINYNLKPLGAIATDFMLTSSDESVATIQGTHVIPASEGQTIITAKMTRYDGTTISKSFALSVIKQATQIDIESEIYCSENKSQLIPSVVPDDPTCKFEFVSLSDMATVDQNGVVTKICQGCLSATIKISTTSNNINLEKYVKVVFTDQKPFDLEIPSNIVMDFDQSINISDYFIPQPSTANITSKMLSGNTVVEINNSIITPIAGGKTLVELTFENSFGQIVSKQINITVLRGVENINENLQLDYLSDEYITAQSVLNLNAKVIPVDSTNHEVEYAVVSGNAFLSQGKLYFTTTGSVVLKMTADQGKVEKQITIKYVGPFATEVNLKPVQSQMTVGQSICFEVESYFPTNAPAPMPIATVESEISTLGGSVLLANGAEVVANQSGRATVKIAYQNSLCKTYVDFDVQSVAYQIYLSTSSITISDPDINLSSLFKVLPSNSINKNVIYTISDDSVAQIQQHVLSFKQEGRVEITISLQANKSVCETISVGYQANEIKNTKIFLEIDQKLEVPVGDYVDFEFDNAAIVLSSNSILKADGLVLSACASGVEVCTIEYFKNSQKVGSIALEIECVKLSEQIELSSELMYANSYYTAIPRFEIKYNILPSQATYKTCDIILLDFVPEHESSALMPTIEGNVINFNSKGQAFIKLVSKDKNVSKIISITYTTSVVSATLNQNNFELFVGQTASLAITSIVPSNLAIDSFQIQSSSNNSIEISNNEIKAIHSGNVRCGIFVNNAYLTNIEVQIVQLPTSISLQTNQTTSKKQFTISCEVFPDDATNKNLLFAPVSNSEIFEVSKDGTITFFEAGEAIVEVVCEANPDVKTQVHVISTFEKPQSATIASQITLIRGQSHKLTFQNILPADLSWFDFVANSSDPDVAAIINNVVYAKKNGVATITLSYENASGQTCSHTCRVTVFEHVESLSLEYDTSLIYAGSICTAKPNVSIKPVFYPQVVADDSFKVVLSSDIATFDSQTNQIIFNSEGSVAATFVANDDYNGTILKTITINHTTQFIAVELESAVLQNSGNVEYGSFFDVKINATPVDLDVSLTIENISKYDALKVERSLTDSKTFNIFAYASGTIKFDLMLNNNYGVGSAYAIFVTKKPEQIFFECEKLVVSSSSVSLSASVLPSDANNYKIAYECLTPEIAAFDSNSCELSFIKQGTAIVRAYILGQSSIAPCQIEVEYCKSIKSIAFHSGLPNTLFVGDLLRLDFSTEPAIVEEDYEIEYVSSNDQIATVDSKGVMISNGKAGLVEITARVVGKEHIFDVKTFEFVNIISSIALELKAEDDNRGIAGERVFGTLTYNYEMGIRNTYKMNLATVTGGSGNAYELIWKSSNAEIATVNDFGFVRFLAPGKVTIRVEPKHQRNPNNPVFKEYTFNLVDGVNIFDKQSFPYNKTSAQKDKIPQYANIVLHTDIDYTNTDQQNISYDDEGYQTAMSVVSTLYGNGHLLSFSLTENLRRGSLIYLKRDAKIENITIRGVELVSGSVEELEKAWQLIYADVNTTIENSIIENARVCIVVRKHGFFKAAGCIIRNALNSGIFIEQTGALDVFVKDCIFSGCRFSSIYAKALNNDQAKDLPNANIYLQGKIYFYNWIDIDTMDMDISKAGVNLDGLVSEVKKFVVGSLPKYVAKIDGKNYIMVGIMLLNVNITNQLDVSSKATVDFSGISDQTNVYESFTIHHNFLGAVDANIYGWCLPADNTFCTPKTTYELNENTFKNIRQ